MADRRFRFSVSALSRLPLPESGYVYHYDSTVPSLAVRVSHTGRKSFVWCASRGKRETTKTDDLDAARAYCRMKADAIASAGPTAGLAVSGWTLRQLFEHWMEFHAKPHKRTWQRDEVRFAQHLSSLADRRLDAISQADVIALHVSIKQLAARDQTDESAGSYAANATLTFLSSLFNYAISPALNWRGVNPCSGVRRFPEQDRKRYLTADEIGRFFEAVEQLQRIDSRDFLKLAIFTGQRRQRVLSMEWKDVDIEAGLWFIHGSQNKNKCDQTVRLPSPAIEILKRRQFDSLLHARWVFPSTQSKTGHYNDPKSAWQKVLTLSGLKNLRIHDLRRTLGSWMRSGGDELDIIGKALGHRSREATLIYAQLSDESVRQAVERAAVAIHSAGS